MITFLLVVHTLIAIGLVGVILLQRSEGGGLGIGGGTGGGLMSARGAANLLTRSTTVLASLFILSSIVLAVLAVLAGFGLLAGGAASKSTFGGPLGLGFPFGSTAESSAAIPSRRVVVHTSRPMPRAPASQAPTAMQ